MTALKFIVEAMLFAACLITIVYIIPLALVG